MWIKNYYYSPQQLREGNVFTDVCHSVRGVGIPGPRYLLGGGEGVCIPGPRSLPGGCMTYDTHPWIYQASLSTYLSHPWTYPSPQHTHPPHPWTYLPPLVLTSSGAHWSDGMHPAVMLSCYRPQQSWGKVMFLHMCVILFTGGVSGPAGVCLFLRGCAWSQGGAWSWGGVPGPMGGGGAWSRGTLVLGGAWSRGRCLVPGGAWWRPPDGHCCGRYASYWNAFLFLNYFSFFLAVLQCQIWRLVSLNQTSKWPSQGTILARKHKSALSTSPKLDAQRRYLTTSWTALTHTTAMGCLRPIVVQ